MAMIGANLSIPAIAVLKPGEALPTDLLAQYLGDAGGVKTYHDGAGVLQWNPHNLIRNNSMQGAVAGDPGTAPTYWFITGDANGLEREIIAIGTDGNIDYIDVRWSGTSNAAGVLDFYFEGTDTVAAVAGQLWTLSTYVAQAAGDFTGFTSATLFIQERDATSFLSNQSGSNFLSSIGAVLSDGRETFTATLANASTAYIRPFVSFAYADASAIDVTIRIGWPKINRGSDAAGDLRTTTTARYLYRNAAHYWSGTAWIYGGLLTEEQGTDEIRNSTMQGAATGAPGTPPTNWTIDDNKNGLNREIQNIELVDGIWCIDVRIFGTATATGDFFIQFETNTAIPVVQGEGHTNAVYVACVGGDLTDIDQIRLLISERLAGGGGAGIDPVSADFKNDLTADIASGRFDLPMTVTGANTAYIKPMIFVNYISGANIDCVLRVGLPDNKEKIFADSPVETYGAAVTRVADLGQVIGQELVGTEGSIIAEIRSYIAASGSRQYVIKARAADDQDFVSLFISGVGQATIEHRHGGVYVTDSFAGKTLSDETVHRIAMSWDGTGLSISVDGLPTESVAVTGAFAQALLENYYGARESGLDPYNGFISSLLAFDYKMDAAELEQRSALS